MQVTKLSNAAKHLTAGELQMSIAGGIVCAIQTAVMPTLKIFSPYCVKAMCSRCNSIGYLTTRLPVCVEVYQSSGNTLRRQRAVPIAVSYAALRWDRMKVLRSAATNTDGARSEVPDAEEVLAM